MTADAIDERNVRLTLSGKQSRDLIFTLTALPVFSKAFYSANDFEASTLSRPLGSGPYKVGALSAGRTISFVRDPDYWAKDLPVNVGRFNFDTIRIDFYRDRNPALKPSRKATRPIGKSSLRRTGRPSITSRRSPPAK